MSEEKKELPAEMPQWALDLLERQKHLEQENKMLRDLTSNAKIADWKDQQRDLTVKHAKLKVLDGKPIVAWGVLDYSAFDPNARTPEAENIFIEVVFLDGKKKKLNYHRFTNINSLEDVIILEQNVKTITVKFSDGTVLAVGREFINP